MGEFYYNYISIKLLQNGNHRKKALPLWLGGAQWPLGTLLWAGGTVVDKPLTQHGEREGVDTDSKYGFLLHT